MFIFAGYSKPIEKLFEHNPGLPSRFPHRFVFDDYKEAELLLIFRRLLADATKVEKAPPPAAEAEKKPKPKRRAGQASVTDKWGNVWYQQTGSAAQQGNPYAAGGLGGMIPQYSTWEDDYGNACGDPLGTGGGASSSTLGIRSPAGKLGSPSNPVITKEGREMIWNGGPRKVWEDRKDPSFFHTRYPGHPPPRPKAVPPEPDRPLFRVSNDKWIRILARRLARGRGTDGFGNARAVRNCLDLALGRQAARITAQRVGGAAPDVLLLERDDLLGPRADAVRSGRSLFFPRCAGVVLRLCRCSAPHAQCVWYGIAAPKRPRTQAALRGSAALRKLRSLDGLEEVKEAVEKLLQLVVGNAEREEREQQLIEVNLNLVLLGNPGVRALWIDIVLLLCRHFIPSAVWKAECPCRVSSRSSALTLQLPCAGTGKTTVARLYAQILADVGLISKGEVVLKTPSDFLGSTLGSSEGLTRAIMHAAQGNVLVIDEARCVDGCRAPLRLAACNPVLRSSEPSSPLLALCVPSSHEPAAAAHDDMCSSPLHRARAGVRPPLPSKRLRRFRGPLPHGGRGHAGGDDPGIRRGGLRRDHARL